MRVLLVSDALPPTPRGGLDRHVAELRGALEARGVEVRLLDTGATQAPTQGLPGSGLLREVHRAAAEEQLVTALGRWRPDAVHVHGPLGLSRALTRTSVRVMWTLHDALPICPRVHLHRGAGQACPGPLGGLRCGPCLRPRWGGLAAPALVARQWAWRCALRAADRLLVPSRYLAGELLRAGAPGEAMELLPPATAAPPRLARRPAPEAPPRFVYLGDLRPAKGPALAVEALRRASTPGRRLELWGAAAPEGSRGAGALDGPGVITRGPYEAQDLGRILDGAAAVVVPSAVRESFGRTANEALLRGVPVIAADHGALPEQVVDGVNGLLFVPGDASALAAALDHAAQAPWAPHARWPRPPRLDDTVARLLTLYAGAP